MPDQFDVFLSHNSQDKVAVERLAQRLRAAGLNPFLDKWHLIPGEPWQEALENALDDSATVAVFIGPSGISPWHNEELRDALNTRVREHSYRVIPVLLPGASKPDTAELPRFLTRLTWVDFQEAIEDDGAFHRLLSGIRGRAPGPGFEGLEPARAQPPYQGLNYFDVKDADQFFGRELLSAELVGRLRADRFLAVVGASGSGKSSVVRAGVIAALQGGVTLADGNLPPQGSENWPLHIITPTAHPLESLAASLTRDAESVTATATLIDDLKGDPRSLHLYVRKLLSQDERDHLLLFVDQFEELFTACKAPQERQAFIDNLLTAVADETAGPTVVIITLRADFYHHCAQFSSLRAALEACQKYIGAMTPDELRLAIEKPAAEGGWAFEPGLVDLLLREVGDEPGALPLLSHALLETWQRRRGRLLTLAGYHEAGGVHGAIAQSAETTYQQLPASGQRIARNIFLRLTELGEGTQDTRRRAAWNELISTPSQRAAVEAVLQILADARLVTTAEDCAEVAHEALIREWPTLRQWLEEDREALRLHRHLTESARAWAQRGRDPGDLYRGARLAQAVEWRKAHDAETSAPEKRFLQASQEALTQEQRAARRRWIGITAAIAIALVIATLGVTGQLNRFIYWPKPMAWSETIPAGEFWMGSRADDPDADSDESPQHRVDLDAYQIGRYEVTNAQYNQCVSAGVCSRPTSIIADPEKEQHPVVYVTWDDAQTFCAWTGGRLPTEAEWEKAARGGLEGALYPWGDEVPVCDWGVKNGAQYRECDGQTVPAGRFGANGYGLYDMAGNVWEWTADWYHDEYYDTYPANDWPDNPTGPVDGDSRVVRGGSWDICWGLPAFCQSQLRRSLLHELLHRFSLRPLTLMLVSGCCVSVLLKRGVWGHSPSLEAQYH